jgi:hypothetical protein
MVEKSCDMTRKESISLKYLNDDKQIRILQAVKRNCMIVLSEATHKEKICSLLESGGL